MFDYTIISLMLYNTLRQYEYIVAVADAGSLTGAATRLHVSQPSLSVAITRVEQRLGQPVFVRRKGAPIVVTPFGHRIIEKARALLALAACFEQPSDDAPLFVLGCFGDISPWYLVPALESLKAAFPATNFLGREGRFSDLAADIEEGRADIVISYDIGFEGNFQRRKIKEITPVAFFSSDHPLSLQPSVKLEDLVNHPLILSTEELSEGFMRDLFGKMDLHPIVKQRVTSLEMMRSLAAHGVGVGISYSCPPNDISYDGKTLVTVPVTTPEAATDITLLWSSLREPDRQFDKILDILS